MWRVLWVLGSAAAQGPLVYWVCNHRKHHQFSDELGDPHSPHVGANGRQRGVAGFWHAHVGWAYQPRVSNPLVYARDLYREPTALWVNGHYFTWVALVAALPAIAGGLETLSAAGALRAFYWGTVVRHAVSFHATSSINSITHLWGHRKFPTSDRSRNNVALALPTLGEGWHNNHHAFPGSARLGLNWYEFDAGWVFLRGLRRLGLVSVLKSPKPSAIARAARFERSPIKTPAVEQ